MSRPQAGLRRFARPAEDKQPTSGQLTSAALTSAQAASDTLPPLVAELLQAAGPEDAAAPAPSPDAERCELCKVELPSEHGHIADLDNQTLECACRACYLLFTQPNTSHIRYRAIPDRYLKDPDRTLTPAQFDQLEIPVGLVFFLRSSAADRDSGVVGFYPSPAGATECVLDLAAWERLVAEHPLLGAPAADVEAALISRGDAGVEYFLVPIDACYELVGRMRLQWRGFDGGAEARASIQDFLKRIRSRASVYASGDQR